MDDSRRYRFQCGSIAIELTNSAIPEVLVNVELKCDGQGAGGIFDSPPKTQNVSRPRATGDK